MKKTWQSALVVAMLLSTVATAQAQDEMKPMLIFSFGGYQEMIDDLTVVGEVSDNPDLAKGIEGLLTLATQGQGLPGLDKKKPWGGVVATDGLQFQLLAMLPVNDLEQFLEVLAPLVGEPEDAGNDVWKIEAQGQSLFFKQKGDWSFASISPDFLTDLPEDPEKMLGGLNKKYDLAVKVNFQNIPEIFRQLAVEQLRASLESGGLPEIPGLPELPGGGAGGLPVPEIPAELQALQAELAKSQMEQLATAIEELSEVTFGATIDAKYRKATIDIIEIAVEGSKTADQMAKLGESTSSFAGFLDQDALVSFNAAMPMSQDQITAAKVTIAGLKETILEQLDNSEQVPDGEIKDIAKEMIGELVEIGGSTVTGGQLDMGFKVVGKGPYTIVAGAQVEDPKRLQALVDRLVDILENEVGFFGFEKDADKHGDVRLHSAWIPLPGGEETEAIADFVGAQPQMVFGVGKKRIYFALGEDGMKALKAAMVKSDEMASQKVQPVSGVMHLGPLVKLMASSASEEESDPNLDLLVESLQGGKDRVTMTVKPIENGIHIHIEGEEGLLKALGSIITNLGAGGLPSF